MADDEPRVGRAIGQAAGTAAKRAVKATASQLTKRSTQAAVGASSGGTSIAAQLALRAAKPLLKIALVLLVLAIVVGCIALLGAAASGSPSAGTPGAMTCAIQDERVPSTLSPVYEAAAARFDLGARGPAMLAAINKVETDFGRNAVPSGKGAIGPMQFLPSTWAKGRGNGETRVVVAPTTRDGDGYATDGDNDGLADSAEAADAIHAAARLLRANGAPGDWDKAVYAYNHSSAYVSQVKGFADAFQGTCTELLAVQMAMTAGTRATLDRQTGLATIPADAPRPVQAMINAANRIARSDYVWGGGHQSAVPQLVSNYDCSGAVSLVLHAGGLLDRTRLAAGFMTWGVDAATGGRWVVVYASKDHVWMTIAGLVFDNYGSRGARSMWNDHPVERVSDYVARRPPDGLA
jgi:peptidoglycan DL-endopeptidase CwlO